MSKIQELGLEQYLDVTKGLHNGKGFKDLVGFVKDDSQIAFIARQFGVSRPTVYEWIELIPPAALKPARAAKEPTNG